VSNTYRLAAIEYAAESSFGETSSTYDGHRLPTVIPVDTSGLTWDKQDSTRVEQYLQGGSQWVLMGKGGSFSIKLDLCGHGTTTAGSPTIDAIETFLGYVFGNAALSASASTTLTGGTATAPTTTASGTFAAGSGCRIGTLGDGRGGGQFHAISTHSTTTLNLLTGTAVAPNNADVLYPACNIYPFETPPASGINATVPGLRFRLLTKNLQYACHGCFPTSVSISGLSPGERPQVEITFQVAWWEPVSATFPSALSSNQYNPAPVAAGSLFVADVGTATRTARTCRSFSLEYTLGMVALPGPGGADSYQSIVGCRRIGDAIKVSWVEDADAATTTPVLQGYATGTTSKHVLYTLSTTAGSAVGFYFPKICISSVPTQMQDGEINRMPFEGMAYTGGTTTTDLTASAMRMLFA
jgi:hypothetical protein